MNFAECPAIQIYVGNADKQTDTQNQNQKGIYSPLWLAQTRNLLWQEGAYNKHIGT